MDLTRQVLSKLANRVYLDALGAFGKKNVDDLTTHSQKFIDIILDIDTLLASDNNFLLGSWLESAKKLAVNQQDMKQVMTDTNLWFMMTNFHIFFYFFLMHCFLLY